MSHSGTQLAVPNSRQAADLVIGNGLMHALIRANDWSQTPLGPIEGWSDALISNVNHVLFSPFPAVLCWGEELTFFYNEAAIPTLEGKHPEALGRSYREVFHEAWHLVGPDFEACFTAGTPFLRENMLIPILVDGHIQDEYWTYSLIPIFDRGQVAGVYNAHQNTTKAIVAARGLRAATAQLSQFLGATSDAIVGINRSWEITYLNSTAQKTYGLDRDIVGRQLWEEFPEVVYPGSPYVEHYNRAMNEAKPGSFEAHYPEPLDIWIQLEVYPTRDGIVTFSRDVSERRRTETALLQSEKLAAVGRLASSIAHEINNPLEAVTNLLYLARSSEDVDEIHHWLDSADEELRRMAVIANQTLRFHKQSSRPQDMTCVDLFSTVLSMYEGKLRNAGITIEKRKRANKPVTIFEGDVRQVLNNIIGNAIDAMPKGGRLLVRSREATHWRTNQKGLVLTVADTGTGMPPQVIKRAFEAFYTTKGIGGTGLGLWISKEIAERHQGVLRVRSSQNEQHRGTVFTLFLPFVSAAVPIH